MELDQEPVTILGRKGPAKAGLKELGIVDQDDQGCILIGTFVEWRANAIDRNVGKRGRFLRNIERSDSDGKEEDQERGEEEAEAISSPGFVFERALAAKCILAEDNPQ
ncbi:MAG: hypothetical protein AAGH38_02635 [Pseudomonadota bacterium]